MIPSAIGRQQPSYMLWFVGLGLMVTLVWLYISVLRLLARIRR
ncbi:MAG: Bax inhibitor-1/YccA family protein [Halochromatium sp.]